MEPVTHILTGACLGRCGFNRKTAYATLAMTLAAEAPDLDMFWGLRGNLAQFEHHRGITHTLIGAPFMALLTTGVVWLIHRARRKPQALPCRWGLIWLFALVADLSHILLDFTNSYGVRPFFPFSPHWYAWSIEFLFDPVLFAALLSAILLPWIFGLADREIGVRRTPFRGQSFATAALVFMGLLWGVRNAEHVHAIGLARSGNLTQDPLIRTAAEPYPVNPFHWRAILETKDYYQTADIQTWGDRVQGDPEANRHYKAPVTPAVMAAKQSLLGRVYLDWSSFPLVTDRGSATAAGPGLPAPLAGWHAVEFRDLRFDEHMFGSTAIDSSDPPLSGWVYVNPAGQIEDTFFDGQEQP